MTEYHIGTKCIQAGYQPQQGEPRVLPIIQSTTFKYDTAQDMGDLFDLKAAGYFYSRLSNPTCDNVAAKITALEGGIAGILTSSGQAATTFALLNIVGAGDHIVSSSEIYGGSYNLLAHTFKNLGIETTFVSPDASPEELAAAFQDNTKAVFGETLANPSLSVLDIEKFADAAHTHGVPLIVDNTFPTPIQLQPFKFGADIVIHSTTKYMDGHATAVGGAVIDSGNFDWTKSADKFPGLTTPNETYHGLTFTESFGPGAYITKMVVTLMRDLGSSPAPQNAFLLNIGLETLHLRINRHAENGLAVAEYLEKHPKVAWVNYPKLKSNKDYALAEKYLPVGASGVVSFGIKGGREAAVAFMENLELAAIVTHVADSRTSVLHPASTTHRQMTEAELEAAGISGDLVRFSVGIEDIRDIIADIEQALAQI